eukprot:TRINITY_DN61152_c0_g1_i1.p1 TRINITY_DN61152_c0_g1~~TRINITY_DN61152_c0_g1_i1.p1  ORF type:complete len:450 (+),score=114.95 TRINITY_DN61152_c0_g1_i1:80-1351(+)
MPFASPPGLEPDLDAASFATAAAATNAEVQALTLDAVEEKLKELGPAASRDAIMEAIREVVLSAVEHKVQEKTEALWSKGKQVVATMQQRHKEKTQQLMEEVVQCQRKQAELEAENGRLKQTLQSLAVQFMNVGAGYLAKDGSRSSPDAAASTVASIPSPLPTDATPSPSIFTPQVFTPGSADFSGGGDAARLAQSSHALPDVPAFPFPSPSAAMPPPSPAPAAPISLAESLAPKTPQRTPVSLANSLNSPAPEMPSPFTLNGRGAPGFAGGLGTFSFTLRKADGAELGLNVSHHEDDRVLRVEGVRPDGAVDAWNRQCMGTAMSEKAVVPGDRIICVNTVQYDPAGMLEECKHKQLLKITVVRGSMPLPPAAAATTDSKRKLSADASVFVPSLTAPEPVGNGTSKAEATQKASAAEGKGEEK